MAPSLPFTFGIALTPRAAAGNWRLVETLLDLALASVLAQTDQDFRVIIAGHDRPRTTMDGDPRLTFLAANWPVRDTDRYNDDSGRKKHAINDFVLASGSGLLMLLDADDWVDKRMVEAARAAIGPVQVGGLIPAGFVTDFRTLRAAPLPHPRIFAGEFHRLYGSSTVPCYARTKPMPSAAIRSASCDRTTNGSMLRGSMARSWPGCRFAATT